MDKDRNYYVWQGISDTYTEKVNCAICTVKFVNKGMAPVEWAWVHFPIVSGPFPTVVLRDRGKGAWVVPLGSFPHGKT